MELICLVEKDGKKFEVDMFYRPRKDQLDVVEMKELKEQKPLEAGLELIANLFKGVTNPKNKGLILGSEGEMENKPILGSPGEKEMLLLGAEGEPEREDIEEDDEEE